MNKKQLAEMIKHLRKMKMEQMGGMGKYKGGAVDLQDLSSPNRPVGSSSKEQHHVKEGIGPTYASSQKKKYGIISKMPSDRKLGGNQQRGLGSYTVEAEEDIGPTKTGQKGKRLEKIELEPKQSDEKIF